MSHVCHIHVDYLSRCACTTSEFPTQVPSYWRKGLKREGTLIAVGYFSKPPGGCTQIMLLNIHCTYSYVTFQCLRLACLVEQPTTR